MHQLMDAWSGFIVRMQAAPFPPDIIIVNELRQSDENGDGLVDDAQFLGAVEDVFGDHYGEAHSDSALPTGGGLGGNAVIWNANRLSLSNAGEARWPNSCLGIHDNRTQLAVDLHDDLAGKHVLVAALHMPYNAGPNCVRTSSNTADSKLESLRSSRPMSIIGVDFNQRPDKHGENPENGLEADPDCWYRTFSAAHTDSDSSGTCTGVGANRYYDTAWLWPGSGGGTNPTASSFCEQYTSFSDTQLNDPTFSDGTNSCTDLVGDINQTTPDPDGDGKLDKQRIDYLWVGYENASGNAWTPPSQVVSGFVADAGADLGLDLASQSSYSDHRAVRALLTWPPATL